MIKLKRICKSYSENGLSRSIFADLDLELDSGRSLIILGSSGSGKTTLLNLISGIDDLDSGEVNLCGTDITKLTDDAKTDFRKYNLGFVFQFYNLIPTLTVEENILLPLDLIKDSSKESKKFALDLLERVGLLDRSKTYPDKLSGGEQQRVSLVRAFAHKPKILIADEATGNLDKDNTKKIMLLIRELCREFQVQLVMATHNAELISENDLVVEIKDQKLMTRSK